jgi:hypothetical protein
MVLAFRLANTSYTSGGEVARQGRDGFKHYNRAFFKGKDSFFTSSLLCCCVVIKSSFNCYNRNKIAAQSLRNRCIITAIALRICYESTAQSLCNRTTVAA